MVQMISPQPAPVYGRSTRLAARRLQPRPVLRITWDVLSQIAETVGRLPAETGGPFGGPAENRKASAFHFDESSRTSAVTYSPDYRSLNQLFKTEWNPQGIRLMGFVHSHPGRSSRPSHGDEIYAERILKAIPDMKALWLPIVNTVADTGGFLFTPWAAVVADGQLQIVRGAVQIVDAPRRSGLKLAGFDATAILSVRGGLGEVSLEGSSPVAARKNTEPPLVGRRSGRAVAQTRDEGSPAIGNTFQRVEGAYDLPLMHGSRVIAVGAGGAAEWLEQLARAGVGQFVLIDPDTVSETNLATQQVYRRDIGRPKVDCIAERILDINPSARTLAVQKLLDDLDDTAFARLAKEPIDGRPAVQTLLCGLTDNFFAQARVNRLALNLGLPSLNGQVYHEGRGCEITFTYPGVTPACHRCILSSRYRYYLDQHRENPVTSHGTPIFATSRLNATKGFIALALLHHGSRHPRWGGMLQRIGDRNLVVVRLDPDFSTTVGMRTFDRVFADADTHRLLFDEAIWLPQKPESPATGHEPCPDCGGTGDLRDSFGKLSSSDLREITAEAEPHAKFQPFA